MGRSKKNFIAAATQNKGALHRSLGLPEGDKIPQAKLDQAADSSDPTMRRRASLAMTLSKLTK